MIEKKDSLSNSGDTFGNEPQASRKCSRAFDSVVGEAGSATPSTKQTYRKRGKAWTLRREIDHQALVRRNIEPAMVRPTCTDLTECHLSPNRPA